ncbi:MAG: nucleoside triphosphate pyrophosphohydrolase family protein [Candidatus Micrarchaeaceae archaeon]
MEEYQRLAMSTKVYDKKWSLFYPALALSGEVGELNNKIKKVIRDNAELDKEEVVLELGDILWYVAAIADDLEIGLEEVARKNIEKLRKRQENGNH